MMLQKSYFFCDVQECKNLKICVYFPHSAERFLLHASLNTGRRGERGKMKGCSESKETFVYCVCLCSTPASYFCSEINTVLMTAFIILYLLLLKRWSQWFSLLCAGMVVILDFRWDSWINVPLGERWRGFICENCVLLCKFMIIFLLFVQHCSLHYFALVCHRLLSLNKSCYLPVLSARK